MAEVATRSGPPVADLIWPVVLAGAAVLLMAAGAPAGVRAVPAVALVLYGSGYAITSALFPPGRLDVVLRVLAAFCLSLASAMCGAVLMHAVGVRLMPWTLLGWTAEVTVLAVTVAAWRRRAHVAPVSTRRRRPLAHLVPAIAGAYIITAVTFGVALASEIPRAKGIEGHSTLTARSLGSNLVQLGVLSDEVRRTDYRCVVVLAGRPIRGLSFSLAPGEEWTVELLLPPAARNADVLEARLVRTSAPYSVYRRVNVSLRARP